MLQRRQWLGLAAVALAPRWASASAATTFAAAWDDADGRHFVGVLALERTQLRARHQLEVPTRAHGLVAEPGGGLLALARRPGDWLLRWRPGHGAPQWCWTEPDRRLTGHAVASADGALVYTGETDLGSGAGCVGLRDARSLEKIAEWPSHGVDVHQMLLDAGGNLMVANGGVPTRTETGRVKGPAEAMESSLVQLDRHDGALRGQWCLDDPCLSLRHLAWRGKVLGIALQAEHADAGERTHAPLLACFDGDTLRPCAAPQPLAGYAGDIAATAEGWAVSATRGGGVAHFDAGGRFVRLQAWAEAGALAQRGAHTWAGGREGVCTLDGGFSVRAAGLRLDNHWCTT